MANEQYFSRSWSLLTKHKGWIKPILVMTAASLVPIVGNLGNMGYALEWGRLTAWGVDSAPKQKNVDIGRCIASGWRGFVVALGWVLVLLCVSSAIAFIAALMPDLLGALITGLLTLVMTVVSAFWGTIVHVAELRAAIYERIGAGYRLDRVFDMVSRDTRGLLRVFLISLCTSLIIVAASMLLSVILATELVSMGVAFQYSGSDAMYSAFGFALPWVILTCALFGLAISFLANASSLIVTTATALWMRQFDVPNWGRSEDPLPDTDASVGDWDSPRESREEPVSWQRPEAPQPKPAPAPQAEPPAQEPEPPVREPETMRLPEPATQVIVRPQETGIVPQDNGAFEDDFDRFGIDLADAPDDVSVDDLFAELNDLLEDDEDE